MASGWLLFDGAAERKDVAFDAHQTITVARNNNKVSWFVEKREICTKDIPGRLTEG